MQMQEGNMGQDRRTRMGTIPLPAVSYQSRPAGPPIILPVEGGHQQRTNGENTLYYIHFRPAAKGDRPNGGRTGD